MSLLARGSQAADSPWAESAERGHSLLGVLRGETPWAGYRGGALIGTGQSPGPRQSPQLRKAKRVVIVGYNRPAYFRPHAPASFFSLPSNLSATSGATGRCMGSESSGAGGSEVVEAALAARSGRRREWDSQILPNPHRGRLLSRPQITGK